jgi:hypothetical protein
MTDSALSGQPLFLEQQEFMATVKPNYTAVEVNGITGKTVTRELTENEIAELPQATNETPIVG